MPPSYRHTDEEFARAVREATTVTEVGRILGLQGAKYKHIKRRIEKLGLDTNHLSRWRAGVPTNRYKNTLEELLLPNSSRDSDSLKQRLLREGIFIYRCSGCLLTEWLGQPIPLQLDHIDGDSSNNTLSNLRLLCPNCHALTPTFCGRNRKNKRERSMTYASKLTEEQVVEVFRRLQGGERLAVISKEFGISTAMASRIKLKKAWRYLLEDL